MPTTSRLLGPLRKLIELWRWTYLEPGATPLVRSPSAHRPGGPS